MEGTGARGLILILLVSFTPFTAACAACPSVEPRVADVSTAGETCAFGDAASCASRCAAREFASCNNLGAALEVGAGTSRDPEAATVAYRRACAEGVAAACFNLRRVESTPEQASRTALADQAPRAIGPLVVHGSALATLDDRALARRALATVRKLRGLGAIGQRDLAAVEAGGVVPYAKSAGEVVAYTAYNYTVVRVEVLDVESELRRRLGGAVTGDDSFFRDARDPASVLAAADALETMTRRLVLDADTVATNAVDHR